MEQAKYIEKLKEIISRGKKESLWAWKVFILTLKVLDDFREISEVREIFFVGKGSSY